MTFGKTMLALVVSGLAAALLVGYASRSDEQAEGRQYRCRCSSGGFVVLVDEAAEAVTAVDWPHTVTSLLPIAACGGARLSARCGLSRL